jgi:DNA polymerase/3'-5' exonuclease PolX
MSEAITDHKQTIIDSLEILRKRDTANKEVFSARAYAKVIAQLKTHELRITSYEDLKGITGIGAKMELKIKEILETGFLESAQKAKELYNIDALEALQNIYGVGPAAASTLVKTGITSIVRLREAIKENPKLLNDKQKIGLKYYEDLLERIPRSEMIEHHKIIEDLKPDTMADYEIEIVGSYRREAVTSGDIDVLIRNPRGINSKTAKKDLALYVKALEEAGYIKEILALGEHKCMAISKTDVVARRLDLLMTPDEEYAYALLYFTGSDRFNVAFRQYALAMGYSLNEHTFTKMKDDVKEVPYMESEKDIFKFIGLRYIEPSKRIDGNQIISVRAKPKVSQY